MTIFHEEDKLDAIYNAIKGLDRSVERLGFNGAGLIDTPFGAIEGLTVVVKEVGCGIIGALDRLTDAVQKE